MDPLSALRQAYSTGRPVTVEGLEVLIDGVRYAGSAQTAFRGADNRLLDLSRVVAFWDFQVKAELSYGEYVKACGARKVGFVIITDRDVLAGYLKGTRDAAGRIDARAASEGAGAAAAAAGGIAGGGVVGVLGSSGDGGGGGGGGGGGARGSTMAGGVALPAPEALTIKAALQYEQLVRTRASVLECPTRNLREKVFEHFAAAAGGGAGAASAPASAPVPVSSKKGGGAAAAAAAAAVPVAATKRARADPLASFRGTPIIIVPAAVSSMINMFNAKALLIDGAFVRPEDARAAAGGEKQTKITLRRTDSRGAASQYYVIDDPTKLARHDWLKVVAVFAAGPEWQFKGWKWGKVAAPDTLTKVIREPEDIAPIKIFDKGECVCVHSSTQRDDTCTN